MISATMSAPLVSVILPMFTRAGWLERAVESVLTQTHQPVELIVVDDGSTDETPHVLDRFGRRIVRVSQPHVGA